jgi:hypothetical protein
MPIVWSGYTVAVLLVNLTQFALQADYFVTTCVWITLLIGGGGCQ